VQILKRALLWSVVGSLTAVVIWSALSALLWVLNLPHASARDLASETLFGFLSSAIWALIVASIAAPVYVVIFGLWHRLRIRLHPRDTTYTRALLSLALALPAAAAIVWNFGHTRSLPFNWARVEQVGPLAILACWGGVWLPQRILRPLTNVLVTQSDT
jgi:hypothetical protein